MPRGAGLRMLAALGAARALVLPRRCAARSLTRYATDTERGAPKLPKGQFRPKQSLGQNYLQDPNYAAAWFEAAIRNLRLNFTTLYVPNLRQEVTAVLNFANASRGDEVVVKLNSGGGTVTGYGLAAA